MTALVVSGTINPINISAPPYIYLQRKMVEETLILPCGIDGSHVVLNGSDMPMPAFRLDETMGRLAYSN